MTRRCTATPTVDGDHYTSHTHPHPHLYPDDLCPRRGIEFTYVPPYGSTANLEGRVYCINPADYKIAVDIFVGGGWWTKPYWAYPLTPIRTDGTFTVDITTGGNDPYASKIAAFLVPNGYTPPQMSGGAELPAELYQNAVAYKIIDRPRCSRPSPSLDKPGM